jgi:hypothetical protein
MTLVNPSPTQTRAVDSSNVASTYAGTVTSDPVVLDVSDLAPSVTVTIVTPSATTATVEYSTTPGAAMGYATANWQFWPDGTVNASTSVTDVFVGRLQALRITRASGSGSVVYEVGA